MPPIQLCGKKRIGRIKREITLEILNKKDKYEGINFNWNSALRNLFNRKEMAFSGERENY